MELTAVTMEFWDTDRTGVQRLHFVVTLTNSSVAEVKQHLANDLLTEDLSFTFQEITVNTAIPFSRLPTARPREEMFAGSEGHGAGQSMNKAQ